MLKDKLPIVDVNGSYLHRKEQKLNSQGLKTSPLSLPGLPLTGRWEIVTADNYKEKNVPNVTPGLYACTTNTVMMNITNSYAGLFYTYLSKVCERIAGHGAFRALQRGLVHETRQH